MPEEWHCWRVHEKRPELFEEWSKTKQESFRRLVEVLVMHFGSCPGYERAIKKNSSQFPFARLQEIALHILEEREVAAEIKLLDGSRTSAEDYTTLYEAGVAVRRAAEKVADLGWYGGLALEGFATDCFQPNREDNEGLVSEDQMTPSHAVHDALVEVAAALVGAAKAMDQNEPRPIEELAETVGNLGLRSSYIGYRTADACAEAYLEMSGREPGYGKKSSNGHGPFPRFVADAFIALGLKTSPAYAAQRAVKRRVGGSL